MKLLPCPCCGKGAFPEDTHGTYIICKICGWEDDPVQFEDPDFKGGANEVSLTQARHNFALYGASDPKNFPK